MTTVLTLLEPSAWRALHCAIATQEQRVFLTLLEPSAWQALQRAIATQEQRVRHALHSALAVIGLLYNDTRCPFAHEDHLRHHRSSSLQSVGQLQEASALRALLDEIENLAQNVASCGLFLSHTTASPAA
jgi:hypothetical protein